MRILHVLETLAAGGVETTFLEVLKHLPRAGVSHDVLAFAGGALEPEFRAAANVVIVEPRQPALARLVTDRPYDIAHVLFERCALRLLPDLLTRTSTRVVYGKNYDFSGQWRSTEGFIWAADDALLAACDAVTFTTPQLARAFPDAAARATILGKGANVRPLLGMPTPGPDVPNQVLVIANPTPRKRLGDLVAALASVRLQVPDATVRVVGAGDPNEVARLSAQAAAAGLQDHFRLTGPTRNIAAALASCRVFALASGSEGVPTAALEAMAAARPVVTTDAGHVRSIVGDGVHGFVVPVGDIAALAERIGRLLEDRGLAAEMGVRARTRATEHAVEHIATRLFAVLTQAAA